MIGNKKNQIFFIVAFIAIVVIVVSLYKIKVYAENERIAKQALAEIQAKKELEEKLKTSIDGAGVVARSVSVYDLKLKKKLYSRNDKEILPLASLTKIMTAIVALDNIEENTIKISKEGLKQKGDYGLMPGEIWNKNDLTKFTLVISSNDGAQVLVEYVTDFIHKMNVKLTELDIQNTKFSNATGLDLNSSEAGAYGTAEDVNKLAIYALEKHPEVFLATTEPVMTFISNSGFTHTVENTNLSLAKIPNIIFSKTGLTNLAGGNLVVIFENLRGHKIAVTILGSTETERFSDIEKIVKILYNHG